MTSKKRLFLAWLPTLIWLLVIATESTSALSSEHTYFWTRRVLTLFFPHITLAQIAHTNAILRKIGHFTGYATMSWFAFRGWMETLTFQRERRLRKAGRTVGAERRWHLRASVLAVVFTIGVAAVDEFHQSYLPSRTGVVRDVILDAMGGVFAQALLLLYWTRGKRNGRRELSKAAHPAAEKACSQTAAGSGD